MVTVVTVTVQPLKLAPQISCISIQNTANTSPYQPNMRVY